MAPILETMLLPTASTAPLGDVRLGPSGAVSCTRNSLMAVPFHVPTVPLEICISLLKMKLQIRDSYHPSAIGDHSNECTRTGDASTPTSLTWLILRSVSGEAWSAIKADLGIRAETCWIVVRIVCKGSSGSQLSIHCAVGSKWPF